MLHFILSVLAIIAILAIGYPLFHELGHALVGLICGGKISEFRLGINAHVTIEGASYNRFSKSIMHLAGTILPVLLFLLPAFYYNAGSNNYLYHVFFLMLFALVVSSLFPAAGNFDIPAAHIPFWKRK